jgi:hypothetical protein
MSGMGAASVSQQCQDSVSPHPIGAQLAAAALLQVGASPTFVEALARGRSAIMSKAWPQTRRRRLQRTGSGVRVSHDVLPGSASARAPRLSRSYPDRIDPASISR